MRANLEGLGVFLVLEEVVSALFGGCGERRVEVRQTLLLLDDLLSLMDG